MANVKKVLFIVGTLDSGGVSKSIVTLMNTIDKQRYDVHLLILGAGREPFGSQLPDNIAIHSNRIIENLLGKWNGVKRLICSGHIFLAIGSVIRMALSRYNKAYAGWLLAKLMPCALSGVFDVVIDYNGQHVLYYMIDKIKGKKKISYFHDDYKAWDYYKDIDCKYLPKADHVVVITDHCRKSILDYFPQIEPKLHVIENIVNPVLIESLSKEYVPEENFFNNNFVLLTVGHVSEKKGFDFALTAAQRLKEWQIDFKWVFIGTYNDEYVQLVKEKGLDDIILFYGIRKNPYPYFRLASAVVHPARYESQAIVVSEARLLCKPIVVTRFSTVKDILLEDRNALVAEMNGESLAVKLRTMIENEDLRCKIVEYLKSHITDNTSEIDKLYKLIDE